MSGPSLLSNRKSSRGRFDCRSGCHDSCCISTRTNCTTCTRFSRATACIASRMRRTTKSAAGSGYGSPSECRATCSCFRTAPNRDGRSDMNAWGCALFLVAAFVIAGVAQTAWFVAPVSRRFAVPLDGGASLRGRRIFGDNKALRGFLVMVPAAALSFMGIAFVLGNPAATGLWPLTPAGYAWLGACAGFGFMAGELPNSFVKRQLDIDPGQAPRGGLAATLCFIADRTDSILGMLIALSCAVPVPALTWFYLLVIGPGIHLAFSALLYRLGVKARPA